MFVYLKDIFMNRGKYPRFVLRVHCTFIIHHYKYRYTTIYISKDILGKNDLTKTNIIFRKNELQNYRINNVLLIIK